MTYDKANAKGVFAMTMKSFSVRMRPALAQSLRAQAAREGISTADLIRQAAAASGQDRSAADQLAALEQRLTARIDATLATATEARNLSARLLSAFLGGDDQPTTQAAVAAKEAA